MKVFIGTMIGGVIFGLVCSGENVNIAESLLSTIGIVAIMVAMENLGFTKVGAPFLMIGTVGDLVRQYLKVRNYKTQFNMMEE